MAITMKEVAELAGPARLTPREIDVIVGSIEGASTAEMAERFGITPRAVRLRWENARRKLRHEIAKREETTP